MSQEENLKRDHMVRLFIESVTDYAIFMLDTEGRIASWNRGAERLKGYTAEEAIGAHFSMFFTEEDRRRERPGEILRRAAEEGVYAEEHWRVRKDGTSFWAHVTVTAVRDSEQRLVGFGKVTRDLTERRKREDEQRFLAEAGEILSSSLDYEETLGRVARLLVPSVADWCAVYIEEAGDLRLVDVAHRDPERGALAWEFRHRYPPDSEAPKGSYNVYRSGESEVIPEISADVIEEHSPDPEYARLVQKLGLRSAMTVPMIARGRPLGVISLVAAESGRRYCDEDLPFAEALASRAALAIDNARLHGATEAARGEAERRAREETALRDAAGAVTASFTVEEVIQQISRSALTATNSDGAFVERICEGAGHVEVVAAAGESSPPVGYRHPFPGSFVELVVAGNTPETIPRLADAERPLSGDLVRKCPTCSGLIIPLANAGEPIGALFLVRAPERMVFREDEAERALTFGDLAALAFRKVHILEESERRREELERVTESRARLIRGFSHDLKNPLGAADGFLQLIDEGLMDGISPRAKDGIVRSRRAIGSALALIDDLLDLAKAEAGQMELRQAPTDLREAAREIAEEYRAKAEAGEIELDVELPEDFPVTTSDAARIRQVLGNLISNAVKYTPRGGRVSVRPEVRDGGPGDPGRRVAVTVSDTGPGIPHEQQQFLFQEFTRLESAGETPGAGIGLAISKRIANALDGDLLVDSEPGQGSRFTFWVPLVREAPLPGPQRAP